MGDSRPIQARVYVTLKRTVLDPQGQTIRAALSGLGYGAIGDVRQGKYFEIAITGKTSRGDAERELNEIAREVLANPVIEEYRVEIVD